MEKTKFRKNRIHVAICDTCKGNGYITLPDAEDPREPKDERELVKKAISDGLRHIAKTADNDGYAFS